MIGAAKPPQPDSIRILVNGQVCRLSKMGPTDLAGYSKLLLKAGATSLRGLRAARTGEPNELRPALRRIYLSLEAPAGMALGNLELAKQLTPAQHREVVARQNQLQHPEPGQYVDANPIAPASTVVHVRQAVRLQAMKGEALLDWAEIQILAAQEQIKRNLLAKRQAPSPDESMRQLELLALAELNLVHRAWPVPYPLTPEERCRIIVAQDKLNLIDELAPIFEIYAARAYLEIQ